MRKRGYMSDRNSENIRSGVTLGSIIAVTLSWSANKSILWAIVHGLMSWLYVVYYAFFK
jgi:hypothetical protein